MTKYARRVLAHVETAIDEFKNVAFEDKIWELRWVTVISLMRAVLHVSYNVDCKQSSQLKQYWDKKKKDPIFIEFIESERNLTLKEFNCKGNKDVKNDYLLTENGEEILTELGLTLTAEDVIMFQDIPLLEKLEEAMQWLKNYLDDLDRNFFAVQSPSS